MDQASQNMITTRTPFRISLGGGGTDLPSYYEKFGGFFISAAIDKYMYITVHKHFYDTSLRVGYSKTENVGSSDEVQHPIVKEALKHVAIKSGVEIFSVADAPAEAGLGSSGSFTVGLLRALYAFKGIKKTQKEIADEACDISMNKLHEPSGKQDEYVASFGGIRAYNIDKNGNVTIEDLKMDNSKIKELESNIMMFYTGISRKSSEILSKQQEKIKSKDSDATEKMHKIKQIGIESKKALEEGNLRRFGELLHEHWVIKRGVTNNMSSDNIDRWYNIARQNGAMGGKIIGAGGGGFLMLYCDNNKEALRTAMSKEGLVQSSFKFDFDGSKVVYNVDADRIEVRK